ncbi:MAG: DUF3823 domain-containing protein [Bacteroides nordii]
MKATFYLLTIIFFSICFVACEKDNLDIAPNATFGGEIRDMETGELVEQEIIRGSQIYFIELGWDNPPVQAMAVKNDGTFQNNLMFAGDYKIILNKGIIFLKIRLILELIKERIIRCLRFCLTYVS